MTGRDKICHEVMAATGCDYTAAMRERDLRWANRALDAYLVLVRKLPARTHPEQRRCVSCLADVTGVVHSCRRAA